MASIDFPTAPDFPVARFGTMQESFVPNYIESENDGAKIRRRILSETFETFSYTVLCTDTQRQNLKDFVKDTSQGGTLPFNWEHPLGDIYVCQFASLPEMSESGSVDKPWTVSISLEVISS